MSQHSDPIATQAAAKRWKKEENDIRAHDLRAWLSIRNVDYGH